MFNSEFFITILNYPFTSDYNDTWRVENRTQQLEKFKSFNNLTALNFTPVVNLRVNDFFNFTHEHILAESDNLLELLNQNYVIIKETKIVNELPVDSYYFFFVLNSKSMSGDKIQLILQRDVMQTDYALLDKVEGTATQIHEDRWKPEGNDFKMNFDKFFIRELEGNKAKKPVTQKGYKNFVKDSYKNIFAGIEEHIKHWMYVYTVNTAISPSSGTGTVIDGGREEYEAFFAPVLDNGYEIRVIFNGIAYVESRHRWSYSDLLSRLNNALFVPTVGGAPYPIKTITTTKSRKIPFEEVGKGFLDQPVSSSFDSGAKTLTITLDKSNLSFNDLPDARYNFGGVVFDSFENEAETGGRQQSVIPKLLRHNTGVDFPKEIKLEEDFFHKSLFTASEIKNNSNTPVYNPKMYSSDYQELSIQGVAGETFSYDFQKMGANSTVNLNLIESIIPQSATEVYAIEQGFYKKQLFNGLFSLTDRTTFISEGQYARFSADNKNYILQANQQKAKGQRDIIINSALGYAGSGVATAAGIATGNPLLVAGGVIGGAKTFSTGISNTFDVELQYNIRMQALDNLRAAPDVVVTVGSDVLLTSDLTSSQILVIKYESLTLEEDNIHMIKYGVAVNKIGNLKDFENIRKNLNFVRGVVNHLSGVPLTSQIESVLKTIFINGIGFWNLDTPDYNAQNYENYLDVVLNETKLKETK